MANDDPKCGKCGAPVESGIQFAACPHGRECELYPHDGDEEVRKFADDLIREFPND